MNPRSKMVNCPLSDRCDTVGKKHEANSGILRRHTEQAKREAGAASPLGANLAPKAVSGLTSDDDLERYEEFIDNAGVDYWLDDYKGIVMVRSDGRQIDISKNVAEDFTGGPSDSPVFATAFISMLDTYREYNEADSVLEAVDYALEQTGSPMSREALANAVATGRNVHEVRHFMPEDAMEFTSWYRDAISEAHEAGMHDNERRLGLKVLDEAKVRKGIEIDTMDYDRKTDRTSVSLSDPDGNVYEFSSMRRPGDEGRRSPEEIIGQAAARRSMVSLDRENLEFKSISENQAGEYFLANVGARPENVQAYRKAYIRARQITGVRRLGHEFLG